MRSYPISIDSSVYIDKYGIEKYSWEGLDCILDISDIEVFVKIEAEIEPGCAATYESPSESTNIDFKHFSVTGFKIYADNNEHEENIKFLMTKEHKASLEELCHVLISDNWEKYESELLESLED